MPNEFIARNGLISLSSVQITGSTAITGSLSVNGSPAVLSSQTSSIALTSGQVTTALGYTPYNSTNPNGYNTGTVTSVATSGGYGGLTLTGGTITTTGTITLGGTPTGTWPISVSGNAATATSSPLLSALANYAWTASTLPTSYNLGIQASFVGPGASEGSWQNYGSVITMRTYSGGGGSLQLYVPYGPSNGGTGLQARFGNYDVSTGNSWTGWKILLASDNYNSYSPTLTGTGASGTWGIRITGFANAGSQRLYSTDTSYNYGSANPYYGYLTYNSTANRWRFKVSPASPDSVEVAYSDSAGSISGFGNPTTSATGNTIVYRDPNGYVFGNYINLTDDGNPGSGTAITSFITKQNDNYYRSVSPTNAMVSIRGVASGTWGISISGGIEATQASLGYSVSGVNIDYGGHGGPQIRSQGGGAAMMSFHRPGSYAINFGLGTDNQLRTGGWSRGGNYVILDSGNYTSYSPSLTGGGASGTWGINVTGYATYASYIDSNPNRTDVAAYPVVWSNGSAQSPNYSCAAVTIQSSTGTLQATTLRATADVVAYYSSDKRLKDNIIPIKNAVDKIQKIGGYEFDWNDKQTTHKGHDIGIIAQEIEEILPEIVANREDGFKSVKYERLIPVLIEAIKEQQQQIDELKTIINGLTK